MQYKFTGLLRILTFCVILTVPGYSSVEPAHAQASYPETLAEVREQLQSVLEKYRNLSIDGGWPEVEGGPLLREGDVSDRVPVLRERLAKTGDLEAYGINQQDRVFDRSLADALRGFQRRHGLVVDGILGPNTLAALNQSVEQRIRQIEQTLTRWDQLPENLGDRYIIVNIPEYKLRAYENGALQESMRVIVGGAYDNRATPTFNDRMEYVVFNPYWNIPQSIATGEILPEVRQDSSYLEENGYQIVSSYEPDAEVFDLSETGLSRVESGELRLRQEPGPDNALGQVKFMFPNEYSVYLHDTPADQLFDETERDFSHGCIRVEHPTDLASFVLDKKPGWDRSQIREAMRSENRQEVSLEDPIPVAIVYWPVFVDEEGKVQFRPDIYDRI